MSQSPLSARVPSSPVLIPTGPDGITWRSPTSADIDAMHAVSRAADPFDHPHFTTQRSEIADEFEASYVDAARDMLLALDGDRVVAWGMSTEGSTRETIARVFLSGTVHPEYRAHGIGRELIAWETARAHEQLAAIDEDMPGWILNWIDEGQADKAALLGRAGFHETRFFLELTRDLADPIDDRTVEGYRIVEYDPALSEQIRVSKNDAFRDHWGSQPQSREAWEQMVGHDTFRPDLSVIAISDDGEVAGLVSSDVFEEDFEVQGFSSAYIGLVGVSRAHRGRKLAPAMLAAAMRRMADAGLERAVLDVDSENPTGALGLYGSVGFVQAHRNSAWSIEY